LLYADNFLVFLLVCLYKAPTGHVLPLYYSYLVFDMFAPVLIICFLGSSDALRHE